MKKIKAQLGTIVLVVFVLAMWGYTHYRFKQAKSYAVETCQMANDIKNKDKIQLELASKIGLNKKNIKIISDNNRITIIFSGALLYDRAICDLFFKDNILDEQYIDISH